MPVRVADQVIEGDAIDEFVQVRSNVGRDPAQEFGHATEVRAPIGLILSIWRYSERLTEVLLVDSGYPPGLISAIVSTYQQSKGLTDLENLDVTHV